MLLGAHVSTSGGVASALPRAATIGATAMQIFTKQASQWREPAIDADERARFREGVSRSTLAHTNAHDSYLINLASPDASLRTHSLLSFLCELKRCEGLGLGALVSHPGNFIDDRASGLDRNAEAIGMGLELVPGRTRLLLETTAGSGTALGATFEELAALIERIPAPHRDRVGVCVDTAHVFAAGYDLAGDFDGVWRHFDDAIGLARLGMLHLNDSKAALGSRRDRHELIGDGALGPGPFRRLMTDDRFVAIPKVIETPKLDDAMKTDRRMLSRLRRYAQGN
ncbi:MAG TPA: deoxyribonuclease IV [Gemmatimonadaceae bacterium]|nr:deoxyribonuclease IV [Gemmatimonadaceae bacterium]